MKGPIQSGTPRRKPVRDERIPGGKKMTASRGAMAASFK